MYLDSLVMLQIGLMSLCPAHHSCLNSSCSLTAKTKWDIFRIKTLQYGTVHILLQNCSTLLVDRIFTLIVPLIVAETNLCGTPASFLSSLLNCKLLSGGDYYKLPSKISYSYCYQLWCMYNGSDTKY